MADPAIVCPPVVEPSLIEMIVFTAIGSAVFWGKWGSTKLRTYILHDILNMFNWVDETKYRPGIECIIFIVLGCLVGIFITSPTNATQALVTGMAWTGLFTASHDN